MTESCPASHPPLRGDLISEIYPILSGKNGLWLEMPVARSSYNASLSSKEHGVRFCIRCDALLRDTDFS